MKLTRKACHTDTCLVCRLCQPAWKPAIDAHKEFRPQKGELLFSKAIP